MNKRWLDNAFWEDASKKDSIEAILEITEDSGRVVTQQLVIGKYGPDKKINPDFKDVIAALGRRKITANTKERAARKQREAELEKEKIKAEQQQKEMEKLFEAKLKMLEIDEIKNTTNRKLKSKLRRSKNTVEMQMYATLIMMDQHGIQVNQENNDEL